MELNKLQKIIIECLAQSPLKKDFYWTGGTALAFFYLKHRNSLDIDLFSEKEVDYNQVIKLINTISQKTNLTKIEEQKIFDRWEFYLSNSDKLKVEFVQYDFPALKKREIKEGILVDSLDDMSANKTMALIERHEPKDVFDIYYLIKKQKYTPEKLLKLAKKKFGLDIDLSTFWSEALMAAKNLQEIKVLQLPSSPAQQQEEIENIQQYFKKNSAQYLNRFF